MRSRLVRLFVLSAVVLAVVAVAALPAAASTRDDYGAAILKLIAAERAQHGLPALHEDAALSRAALGHARDMVRRDYFSHTSPGGAGCGDRARRAGYRASAVGEVIAVGGDWKGTPEQVFKGLMDSPSHRAVILCSRWRDVGVAAVQGRYRGFDGALMYVVDFGRRSR
jgi:uncharacterized protein YkwD